MISTRSHFVLFRLVRRFASGPDVGEFTAAHLTAADWRRLPPLTVPPPFPQRESITAPLVGNRITIRYDHADGRTPGREG